MLKIVNLKCEYHRNPIGIDSKKPRLSWEILSDERQTVQSAYHILVAGCREDLQRDIGSLWDTGKKDSNFTFQIEYEGADLESFQECHWKVRVWDTQQRPSDWSDPGSWTMGILDNSLWQGSWISSSAPNQRQLPYFRLGFQITRPVKRALLFATARGLYQAYLNGRRVGADEFTPGWTDYHKRIHYNCYDVTEFLTGDKEQVAAAILADGWYRGRIGFTGLSQVYGPITSLLINLRIGYSDGTVKTVVTDDKWKWHGSPILESSILDGEVFDARMDLSGWNEPGFKDPDWRPVAVYPVESNPPLTWYPGNPVRRIEEVHSRSVREKPEGSFVFDLGLNIAGRVRLRIEGKPGTVVRVRHGEKLNRDGSLYIENLRSARSTDEYIMSGKGVEIWEPVFTYHGFQYVELSGLGENPGLQAVKGIALSSDTPPAGRFRCSDELLNQLHVNIIRTQRANYLEIPTDCPQRDERLGWSGDAQVFIGTALYNMDVSAFYTKWLIDLMDAQFDNGAFPDVAPRGGLDRKADAAWGDAGIICPWTLFNMYGDRRLLRRHYLGMKKWVEYLINTSDNFIRRPGEKIHCYGDWLSIASETPEEIIMTAYFARSVYLLARIAGILGETGDESTYNLLFEKVRNAFRREFTDPDGRVASETQTAYLLALRFDLLAEEQKEKTASLLVADLIKRKFHLTVGFVGAAHVLPVLSQYGYTGIAYKVLQKKNYPSWLYSVEAGATTIWERWDSWRENKGFADPLMNSFSHCAFGCAGYWLFTMVCGIDYAEPGFRRLRIAPRPGGGLRYARAEYHGICGLIKSEWEDQRDRTVFSLGVPANTQADVSVPGDSLRCVYLDDVLIGQSRWACDVKAHGGIITFTLGSGNYVISVLKNRNRENSTGGKHDHSVLNNGLFQK